MQEELTVVWLLLITVVVATYFLQAYRVKLLPPSSSALLLGIFFGGVSRVVGLAQPLRFSPATFFYALLPPIVFAAGFTLKKRAFFDNISAILCFSILGTFASAATFGLGTYFLYLIGIVRPSNLGGSPFVECMMYGAAISSIDPVATLAVLSQTSTPPLLYNLVFGESVLNDAVAIVLFRSLSSYTQTHSGVGITTLPAVALGFCILAAGSILIGIVVALACAFLLKRFDAYYSSRSLTASESESEADSELDPTLYEISIVVMGSYLAYLIAEVVGMSGIVALFFSGICHAHYSHYNVSSDARVALRRLFEVLAFLCEVFVFAYLGLQVLSKSHAFDFGLFFSGIPLAIASRAANVFPCSKLVNSYSAQQKLPKQLQRMLWAVGLRGAVAYGLIVNMPRTDTPGQVGIPAIETAALLIVVTSTLVLGSATSPLLRHLDLEGVDDEELYARGWEEFGESGQIQPDRFSGQHSTFHDRFKEFDETVLKPLFGGRQGQGEGQGQGQGQGQGHGGGGDREQSRGSALQRPLFTSERREREEINRNGVNGHFDGGDRGDGGVRGKEGKAVNEKDPEQGPPQSSTVIDFGYED